MVKRWICRINAWYHALQTREAARIYATTPFLSGGETLALMGPGAMTRRVGVKARTGLIDGSDVPTYPWYRCQMWLAQWLSHI